MNKKTLAVSLLLAILVFLGYQTYIQMTATKKVIKKTVQSYGQILGEAMTKVDTNKMLVIATPEHAQKIELDMMYLGKENKYLATRQTYLKIEEIEIDGSNAVARTKESWEYKERDYNTNQIKSTGVVNYLNTYSLEKRKGKWLVSDVLQFKQ